MLLCRLFHRVIHRYKTSIHDIIDLSWHVRFLPVDESPTENHDGYARFVTPGPRVDRLVDWWNFELVANSRRKNSFITRIIRPPTTALRT